MEIWKALACHGSTLQCLQICLESHKSPQDYNHMREPRYADREGGRQLVVRRSQQEVEVHMPEAMHVQRSVQHGAPQPSDNYWMRRLDILRKLACQGLGLRLVDRRMWATVRVSGYRLSHRILTTLTGTVSGADYGSVPAACSNHIRGFGNGHIDSPALCYPYDSTIAAC